MHAPMSVCMVVVESQLALLASIDVGSSYFSLPRQRPAAAEMIVTKSKKIFVSNDEGTMAMVGWGAALVENLYVFALEYKESFQVVLGLIYYHCKVMRACHKLWHFLNSVFGAQQRSFVIATEFDNQLLPCDNSRHHLVAPEASSPVAVYRTVPARCALGG